MPQKNPALLHFHKITLHKLINDCFNKCSDLKKYNVKHLWTRDYRCHIQAYIATEMKYFILSNRLKDEVIKYHGISTENFDV